jgi:hypothetical protein
MRGNYREIISLPHHVSAFRERMSRHSRAAQFAPFAALAGYDDAVRETARITEDEIFVDEDRCAEINARLILALAEPRSLVEVSYFVRDARKSGGKVCTASGKIKSADTVYGFIVMERGEKIPIRDIVDIK